MVVNVNGLERILKAQKKLDKAILKEAGFKEGEYPGKKIRVAYNVELGELAQEWKGFKYWKKTKGEVDRIKLIEEYADCLHFASSLANNTLDISSGSKRFLEIAIGKLGDIPKNYDKIENLLLDCFGTYSETGIIILMQVLELGGALGFTWEEIEEAYFYKNNLNWERLAKGY